MNSIPQIGGPDASPELASGEALAPSGVYRRVDVEGSVAPPPCNTGAQNTQTLIDCLDFTFSPVTTLQEVLDLLDGGRALEWIALERGGRGYKQGLGRGHIKIFHDGNETMGVHVTMQGKALRQYEQEQAIHGEEGWQKVLRAWTMAGARFARADWAMDDVKADKRDALITIERVKEAALAGAFVSRCKGWEEQTSHKRRKGRPDLVAGTLYFGQGMSELSMRFYDKAAEQIIKAGAFFPEEFHWVRAEAQTRNDTAHNLVNLFIAEGWRPVLQVIAGFLEFKELGTDSNRSRWDMAAWWAAFLNTMDKLRLSTSQVKRTVDRAKGWALKQLAPTLAVIALADQSLDFLTDLVSEGTKRLRPTHKLMLAAEGVMV